jgi:hypothetical protein
MKLPDAVSVTVSTVLLLFSTHATAAPIPKTQACTIVKMKSTTRAFSCLVAQHSRILRGGTGDFAKCSAKLATSFGKAELRAEGLCPTTGDVAAAQSQVEEAVTGLFDVLQASSASDNDALRCVQKRLKVARTFASCATDALSGRATGVYAGDGSDFQVCYHRLYSGLAAIDERYACAAVVDAEDVVLWTGGGYAYLPSYIPLGDSSRDYIRVIVPHGTLTNSDFTGAYMTNADARAADFSGATLVDTRFSSSELANADFSAADLTGSSARQANLELANLGTSILESSCWRDLVDGLCPATLPSGWVCKSGWLLGATLDCTRRPLEFVTIPIVDADFAATDLSAAAFPEAAFVGGTLAGANLSAANFEDATFDGTNLANCDLSGARLGGVGMEDVDLTGVDMSGADLTNGRSVRFVSITGCPAAMPVGWKCLSGMLLGPYVNLRSENLSGLDLSGIDMSGADLTYANLSGVTFGTTSLSGASIYGTDLTGVDLSSVNLAHHRNGNLIACPVALPPGWECLANALVGPTAEILGANFSGLDLSGRDLSNGNLWGCNLTGANLAGANLAGIDWSGSTCPDGTSAGTEGGTCCGHHVGSPPAVCN